MCEWPLPLVLILYAHLLQAKDSRQMRTVGRSGVFRQPVYKQWQRLGQERKSKKNEAVPQLTNSSSFNEGDHEKKKNWMATST